MSDHLGLFGDDLPGVAPLPARHTSKKELLIDAYTQELLDNPPVRSLSPDITPDPDERKRLARRLACKDVPRFLKLVSALGMEIGNAGRTATYKAILADLVTMHQNDELDATAELDGLIDRALEAIV